MLSIKPVDITYPIEQLWSADILIGDLEDDYVTSTILHLPILYRECGQPDLLIAPNGNGFMMFKTKIGREIAIDVQFAFGLIDINGQYNHLESTVTERGQ